MTDILLARHCAPTLAGLKTGALFSHPFADHSAMLAAFLRWNQRLSPKGLRLIPLGRRRGRTLVYLYRASSLTQDLRRKSAVSILLPLGYPCPSPERCIVHLMFNLRTQTAFPHEIGLFLGYPPEDVTGFMTDPAGCRLSGCWNVYGDISSAQTTFAQYRSCTRHTCRQLARGIPLEALAVRG